MSPAPVIGCANKWRATKHRRTRRLHSGGPAGGHLDHHRGQDGQHPQEPGDADQGGDPYVAVASNAGATSHPSWYRNLIAHPQVSLQDGATVYRLRAREADGEDKEHWWGDAERFWPHFPEYRASAGGRDIPVILLEPTETSDRQRHLEQDGEG
jgi:deazaflavin-dependent oxidoreductase (nitroreductase family)